jgi:hypothetical protein
MQSHSPIRTVLFVLRPVVAAVALSIAGLWLFRACVPESTLIDSNDAVGNYLQTVGSIYSVLLAFVVYVVWAQFNDARNVVDREANEIIDLYRIAQGFPDGQRQQLQDSLRRYVDAVIVDEWPAMARCDDAACDKVGEVLDTAWRHLCDFEPDAQCHSLLFEQALARFNDLSDIRTLRLTAARTRIPLAMNLLLYTGAVLIVISTYMMAVESFLVHAVLSGAMGGAIAHVLYLIWDLDNTFAGDWQISTRAFERVRRYMTQARVATAVPRP